MSNTPAPEGMSPEEMIDYYFPQLTVKELIKRLKKIEDKTMLVKVSVPVPELGKGVACEKELRHIRGGGGLEIILG